MHILPGRKNSLRWFYASNSYKNLTPYVIPTNECKNERPTSKCPATQAIKVLPIFTYLDKSHLWNMQSFFVLQYVIVNIVNKFYSLFSKHEFFTTCYLTC